MAISSENGGSFFIELESESDLVYQKNDDDDFFSKIKKLR